MNLKTKTEASSEEGFRLDQTFFIQNPKYKKHIHEEIFQLVWVGEGRWDWNTVYNWPVWLRKFYVDQLTKTFSNKKAVNKQTPQPTGTKPPF